MAGKNPRDSRRYRHAAKRLRRASQVCWLCGKGIDPDLPYTDKGAWTADHVVPLNAGGDVHGALRPAHRGCNSSRGDGIRNRKRDPKPPTSRDW